MFKSADSPHCQIYFDQKNYCHNLINNFSFEKFTKFMTS
jgi:hypothetical protein